MVEKKGSAVREFEEFEVKSVVRPQGRAALLFRHVFVAAGILGGIFAAFVFAAILAHPAGASTPVNPVTAPVAAPVAIPAAPAASSRTTGVVSESQTSEAAVVALAEGTIPAPVATKLAPVTGPIPQVLPALTQAITSPIVGRLDPVVSSVVPSLTPVLSLVTGNVSSVVSGTAPVGANAKDTAATAHSPVIVNALPVAQTAGEAGSHTHAPGPPPPFGPPFQRFPLVTSSSLSGDPMPSSGSNALAVTPGSGLLLPDLAVSRFDPEQSRALDLLFDLRHSPPG
jgi:hypothetical protein